LATLRQELDALALDEHALLNVNVARDERTFQLLCKRAIDLLAGSIFVVLALIPATLIIALICIDSGGVPILRQERVGKYGRRFRMFKFRTMRRDADRMLPDLLALNEQQGPLFKMRRDPRMTRVGRWLRKLSLDELPQLINVVRGEMSLVGPRPPLPHEVMEYAPRQLGRLMATPGLTGLWQVSGRSTLTFDEMVDLDLAYIDGWTLARDLRILALTLPAVISTRGAW
jgi:lipopolysaccharide/colanic/teichoic acid biosynthesis glycosyltransferase